MAITQGTNVPSTIRAGDTVSWSVEYGDYPADSWDLTYYFRRQGEDVVEVSASASGTAFVASLPAYLTAQFSPGRWLWYARASQQASGDIMAATGVVVVQADPSKPDEKTHAEKMMAAYKAVALQRAGAPYNASDLVGSSISYKSDAELANAIDYWTARVNRDRARRESIESGRPRRQGKIWLS